MGMFDGLAGVAGRVGAAVMGRKRMGQPQSQPWDEQIPGLGVPDWNSLPKWDNQTADDQTDPTMAAAGSAPPTIAPPTNTSDTAAAPPSPSPIGPAPTLRPKAPVLPTPPPSDTPDFDSLPSSPRLGELTGLRKKMTTPPSTGRRILDTLMQVAPTLIAAKVGGRGAVSGAAEGTNEEHDTEEKRKVLQLATVNKEIEGERGRQERQYEAGIKRKTAQSQLEANTAYHQTVLQSGYDRMNQQYDAKMNSDEVKALAQGYRKTPDGSGWEQIPNNELSEAKQAYIQAQQTRTDLANAQAEAIPEKLANAKQAMDMAMQRLDMARMGLGLRQKASARSDAAFERDTYGTVGGTPVPGAPMIDGTPVGAKFASSVNPTMAARSKAEQATVIKSVGANLTKEVDANADVLGPVMGRYESLADFIGDPDPQYAKFKAELKSWIALHPAAHGFRGLKAVSEFENAFGGTIRTPEALKAAIEGSYGTMTGLQAAGTPKLVQPGTPGQGSAPTSAIEGNGPELRKKGAAPTRPGPAAPSAPSSAPRAPIGTMVNVRGGGKKKKVSDTGDPAKDWQLVTQ